jgi:uncharacterized protein YdiU (UPF0061 family)
VEIAQQSLSAFGQLYNEYWQAGMRDKLGLISGEKADDDLAMELLDLMAHHKADYTQTFRMLALDAPEDVEFSGSERFKDWHSRWTARLEVQDATLEAAHILMRSVNPAVIPRNHLVEEALDLAVEQGDYSRASKLIEVLSNPFDDGHDKEYKMPPDDDDKVHMTFCGT